MKRILSYLLFEICLLSVGFAQNFRPETPDSQEFQQGVIFFRLTDEYDVTHIPLTEDFSVNVALLPELTAVFEKYGALKLSRPFVAFEHPVLLRMFELEFSETERVEDLITDLQALTGIIKYAEKNPIRKVNSVPNDPLYGLVNGANLRWHFDCIYAEGAWAIQTGNPAIKAAIVDNFVWGAHPDLGIDSINLYNAYNDKVGDASPNTTQNSSDTAYEFSHGTHVSGLVGAKNNNNIGIASIGSGVTLMGIRTATNSGIMWAGIHGVTWAVVHGAKVINMSYSSSYYSQTEDELFQIYADSGVVLVASAGNEGDAENDIRYPAGYSCVISVASVDGDGKLSYFSQHGADRADIAAPGGYMTGTTYPNILSTTFCLAYNLRTRYPELAGTNYDGMQGTSMSSPIVAGLCALLLSFDSTLTPVQIKTLLQQTATPLNPNSPTNIGNNGYINAFAALMALDSSIFKASPALLPCSYEEQNDSCLILSHYDWVINSSIPTWIDTTLVDYFGKSKRLRLHIDRNFTTSPRSCELTVYSAHLDSSFKLLITQIAHPKTLTINKDTVRINKNQDNTSELSVIANVDWTISGTVPPWLSISNQFNDTSELVVFKALSSNTFGTPRSATFMIASTDIAVASIPFTVTQVAEELVFAADKSCIFLGNGKLSKDTLWITSNTNWVISDYDTNLISLNSSSGRGDGFVVISAKTTNSNEIDVLIQAVIHINGLADTAVCISQKAASFFHLPETSVTLGATEGSTVIVPVYSNVTWTILTNSADWLAPHLKEGTDSVDIIFTALKTNNTGATRYTNYQINPHILSPPLIRITQDYATAVLESEMEKKGVWVYPNPTEDIVYITTKKIPSEQFQLLGIAGNVIRTALPADKENNTMNISDLSAGIYFLRITLENNTIITKKVVKR
jgi:hypothetical protein